MSEPEMMSDEGLEAEVGRVLDGHLAAIEAVGVADPERLIAENPAIAPQLRACLAVMDRVDAAADDGRPAPRPDPEDPGIAMIATDDWAEIRTALKIRWTEYCREIGRA